ncbi:M23 family metallopeptidase [Bacillus sp. Marseille-P3661]|uniref:M23 family metallopeptidase n=1 Tax=Bacillus sp. Marseille-P3661 TaxID=1936234 RepID=UPI00215512F8|nr:M23 family metallopeptidase [Bacillus sp. Marseille-P3661]
MRQSLHKFSTKVTGFFQPLDSKSTVLKRAMVASAAIVTLSIGSVYASNEINANDVDTVYHIYHKGERLGVVSDKSIVEEIVQEKVEDAKQVYHDYEISVKDQISYIPEKVFRAVYNNEETVEKLNSKLSILAKAEAIVVNGKPAAFVTDKAEAEQVLNQIKMKYVPEEILAQLETSPDGVDYNDYIIKDVHLGENVTSSEEKVFPEDILSVDDAVELLLKGTLQPKIHVVKEGEVLGSIAGQYDLKLKQLLELNPSLNEDSLIHIGDELNVTAYKPLVTVVVEMEAIRKEIIPFEIEVEEDNTMFKGLTKTKQEGINGEKNVRHSIIKENGQITYKTVIDSQTIKEPTKKIMVKGTKVVPSRGTGDLAWPTVGGYISSNMGYRWGRQHKGIDIARPSNRNILAADNGTVESAGYDGGYGNKIIINHNNGLKTVYAHLSSIDVKVGQTVSRGTKIGVMGSTGNSTGVHLHFEVYENGKLVNPKQKL